MIRQGIICIALLLAAVPLFAATEDLHLQQPKVGLALSGGGARGGAHVGALKALEELDIQIDYIAGTSMGAIVGGLYAAGYSADEIETIMQNMDWDSALSDRPERRDQTMRKKELDRSFLIPYRIGFNDKNFQFPLGVIEGQHLDQIFQELLMPVSKIRNFDDLAIPYRAVATDLVTGREVVLSEGSLADALRASMSVPGVFAPVELDGRMLVDGGMANNLPISVVREMGADIVIAIDISSPLLRQDQLKSVLSVTEQLTGFLTRNNTERQIASLTDQDVLLVPNLEGVSSADFDAAPEIAGIGYETVMAHRERLTHFPSAMPRANSSPVLKAVDDRTYKFAFIEIDNGSVLNDEIIRSRLRIPLNQPIEPADLNRMVDQIYSLDVFKSVTYSMVRNEEGEDGLLIHAAPRAWGPNYFQFGLEFSDDFSGASEFKLGVAYTRNALNAYGGELRVIAAIGREDELSINFYQPIDHRAKWFVEPRLAVERRQFNIWEGDTRLAILDIVGKGGSFGIGRNFNTTNQARLSYSYLRGEGDLIAGELDGPLDDDFDIGEFELEYFHDSMDELWFPRSGMVHRMGYLYARESLGASDNYEQAHATGALAYTRGRNTFVLGYEAGYSFDDRAPVERWYQLGGFGRLSGLIPDQLTGRHLGLLSLIYYRRLNDIDLLPAYAGITLEAGNVWDFSDDISFSSLRTAGSLFVGAGTPLGPVYLAWGYSETGDSTFYFYLGNPFRQDGF